MAGMTRKVVLELLARNRAKGEMAAFNRGLGNIYRSARRMAVGLLAVAGVGGMGYMIKRQMEAIDSTAKLSDRLGMTTEALIGMQHGASIAGVEQETLNKSLEIFSRRLGEVDMGVGQAKYALDKLGLSYKELIGKSPDEAIGIVADQINKLETQAEKAAAANYLFGRSGQQLLNLFESGSIGIEEYRKEVEKLGLSFSRIDAAQVEAANDALTRARATMTGLFRTATIELAPYIEALADKFTDVATSGEGMGAKVSYIFESMNIGAIKAAGFINSLRAEWIDFQIDLNYGLLTLKTIGELTIGGEMGLIEAETIVKLQAIRDKMRQSSKQEMTRVEKFYDNLRRKADEAKVQWPSKDMSDEDIWLSQLEQKKPVSDETDETQEQLEKQAQITRNMTAKINDEIAKMSLSTYDYKLKLMEDEIEKYREAGVSKIALDEFRAGRSKEIAENLAREISKADMEAARNHIENLREIDDVSLEHKIENIEKLMELKREAWGEESEAMALLNEERENYESANIKGWELVNQNIRAYVENLGNWGQKLSSTLGSAFAGAADNFAAMLMKEEVDWKAFGRAYLKQILSMIIQTYILAAIRAAITKDYSYVDAQAQGASQGMQAAQGVTYGGRYDTGGFVKQTGLALVHQGEYVNTKAEVESGRGGGITVNVINNANVEVEVEENQDERTVNLVINAMGTYGPMRRAVSNAGKRRR